MKIEKCKLFYNQWVVWEGEGNVICIVKINPKDCKPKIDVTTDYLTLKDLQEITKLVEEVCKGLTNELHKPT